MSPSGSHENLQSPQSPESLRNEWSRKSSLMSDLGILNQNSNATSETKQSTTDMFKDMLSQKRNMIISKFTSFDGDVSLLMKVFGIVS